MCGFIAQLVEHHTSIAEVTGWNPVEALIFFFWLLLSNYKYELFLIYFTYIFAEFNYLVEQMVNAIVCFFFPIA